MPTPGIYRTGLKGWRTTPAPVTESRSVQDVRCFGEDAGTEVRRETLGGYQVNRAAQQPFKQFRQHEEAVEGLFAGREFNQQIHVAVGSRLVAEYGAEERQAAHPQPAE